MEKKLNIVIALLIIVIGLAGFLAVGPYLGFTNSDAAIIPMRSYEFWCHARGGEYSSDWNIEKQKVEFQCIWG